MRVQADLKIDQIQSEHAGWRAWWVLTATSGMIWAARRRDGGGPVLNEDSPEALDAAIGREDGSDDQ